MRFLTSTIALAALFVFGFAANPASANCHANLEAAQTRLDKVPGDYAKRGQIEKLINKAKKFQDDKTKKKKCGKIIKKANKLLKKASGSAGGKDKSSGGGDAECLALIEKIETNIEGFESRMAAYNYISPHFPSELNIRCPEMEIML